MRLFKWSTGYEVYIPEIDEQHRTLFRRADELHRAILAGAGSDQLQMMAGELVSHLAEHFAHEERLMKSVGYPDPNYTWHKHQHDAARVKLRQFNRRLRQGDGEAGLLLLHFLSDWLKEHTKLTDRIMGAYLRNYSRASRGMAS